MEKERMKKAFSFGVAASGLIIGSFILAAIISSLIVYVNFNMHEAGHFLGCAIEGILKGEGLKCAYSNWVAVPILYTPFAIPAPQQTASGFGQAAILIYLGGPVFAALFGLSAWFAAGNWLKIRGKAYLAMLIVLLFLELNNVVCGTDNPTGMPYQVCMGMDASGLLGWILFVSVWLVVYQKLAGFIKEGEVKRVNSMKKSNIGHLKEKLGDFNQFKKCLNFFVKDKQQKRIIDSGRLAEYYCQKLFDLTPQETPNAEGFDFTNKNNRRIEVKHRKKKGESLPTIGHKKKINFDYLYFVELNEEDLLPEKIISIPSKNIPHKNRRLHFNDAYKNKAKHEIIFER